MNKKDDMDINNDNMNKANDLGTKSMDINLDIDE